MATTVKQMKAYELIDHPSKWFRDQDEFETDINKHCALSALLIVYAADPCADLDCFVARKRLTDHVKMPITVWNDANDWQTVYETMKALDL